MRRNISQEFDLEARCEAWGAGGYGGVKSNPPRRKRDGAQLNVLEHLVASQVIPRLLIAHHVGAPLVQPASNLVSRVGELSDLVIADDLQASLAYVAQLRGQGLSLELLCQDLLAPTARRLGELWEEDINDFMDVTRGMSQLQLILRTFGADLVSEVRSPAASRRALLMPVHGEQHTFGISMVAEQFRSEGWRVWGGSPVSDQEVFKLASDQWFDVIGLSASRVAEPGALAATIRRLRKRSLNPDVAIIIGGKIFSDRPELIADVDADCVALDGRQALRRIEAIRPRR